VIKNLNDEQHVCSVYEKHGTPTYVTYSSMQQEQLGSEFKTKGKN